MIRKIEKIIDEAHKTHAILKLPKVQALYDVLASFQDMCSLTLMGSVLNPLSLKGIVDQMDALNTALIWINQSCLEGTVGGIDMDISEKRYEQCCDFMNQYAYPYSVICSGYISYSRDRFDATVDGNCVTFNFKNDHNNSVWNDIIREATTNDIQTISSLVDPLKLLKASVDLKKQIRIENGMICYELSDNILDPFRSISLLQWDCTKTLPDSWKFDLFSMNDYKRFWVAMTTLCYVHFCSCLTIEDELTRLKNSVIVQPKKCIIDYVCNETGIDNNKAETILKYITYEPNKKNIDIMYQPIVEIDDWLIVVPVLFMGSRPERNLLAVVSTRHDSWYSKEVNDLEELMVSELEELVDSTGVSKHKHLRDDLPDIDFAVLDRASNSALICETKWFAAADSTKEVYAKEDEITHGCEQVESIMAYALSDKNHFFKQVFNVDDGESIDLFCCVVAKHNIRTQNKYVPVIDLKRIKELLSSYALNTVFNIIRNHEYDRPMPDGVTITHQEIEYAGYTFRIPALCLDESSMKT